MMIMKILSHLKEYKNNFPIKTHRHLLKKIILIIKINNNFNVKANKTFFKFIFSKQK